VGLRPLPGSSSLSRPRIPTAGAWRKPESAGTRAGTPVSSTAPQAELRSRESPDSQLWKHQRELPLSAYGLIGDCHTAALIDASGSVGWHCPRRFGGGGIRTAA
jgi:hypothetical protein